MAVIYGRTMCGSRVDIQSPTGEIRRGKKEEERKMKPGWKYIWPALLHSADIINGHYPLRRSRSFKDTDFSTNWKLIYDFLLVINTITNLLLILTSYGARALQTHGRATAYSQQCSLIKEYRLLTVSCTCIAINSSISKQYWHFAFEIM